MINAVHVCVCLCIPSNILSKIPIENIEYSLVYACLLSYGLSLVYPKFD